MDRPINFIVFASVALSAGVLLAQQNQADTVRNPLASNPTAVADGQREGLFRADVKATAMAKMLFGALDEMATNWILSRRRYALEGDAETVVDLFINGARAR